MNNDYDYIIKGLLIGDSGVGKSTILSRYTDDKFDDRYISTIGVDFNIKTIPTKYGVTKLQLWDTAGQERFRTITTSYYRGSHMIIVCYDITDKKSFTNLKNWFDEIINYAGNNTYIILCGTKSDLEKNRKVTYDEGLNYAHEKAVKFIETSSKNNTNINELFDIIVNDILSSNTNRIQNTKSDKKTDIINLNNINIKSNKCC